MSFGHEERRAVVPGILCQGLSVSSQIYRNYKNILSASPIMQSWEVGSNVTNGLFDRVFRIFQWLTFLLHPQVDIASAQASRERGQKSDFDNKKHCGIPSSLSALNNSYPQFLLWQVGKSSPAPAGGSGTRVCTVSCVWIANAQVQNTWAVVRSGRHSGNKHAPEGHPGSAGVCHVAERWHVLHFLQIYQFL